MWDHTIWLLLVLAIIAAFAEFFVIRALEQAETVVLAPVHYTLLIWGTLYGWLIFDQMPDMWTWTGARIIVCTGIYVAHREHKQRISNQRQE